MRRSSTLAIVIASAALVFAILSARAPAAAHADEKGDPGPAVHATVRDGFTIGVAVGPGELHQIPTSDDADETLIEGAGVSLRLGRALSQKMLFLVLVEYVMAPAASNAIVGAAAQIYLSRRVFLRLGGGFDLWHEKGSPPEEPPPITAVGDRVPRLGTGEDERFYSIGALFGGGVEFIQLRDLAINAELMFSGAYHTDVIGDEDIILLNVSLMLGIQWY